MDLSERSENNTNRHPWELSRTSCLMYEMKRNIVIKEILKNGGSIVDIGCGDAYFSNKLASEYPNLKEIWGVDIFQEKDNLNNTVKIVNDLKKVPFQKTQLFLMMDVLEHIKDDIGYLQTIKKKLDKNGRLFITVPAFQSLYSLHDKELHHYRRYQYKELKKKLNKVGFQVESWHYFYTSLIIGRLLTKNRSENLGKWKRSERNIVTKFVKYILNIDYMICYFLSKIGIPIGGLSLLIIAKHMNK